ncbi:hypothetical protein WJX81_001311 [Elliptochloris bilobata]|uniref:enoyl-[acyl-carrier-protein] reductase n=1 Tax=Elliptochloris bilobata TaxID=381761 RepID=A0AAW1RS74_9CHLO
MNGNGSQPDGGAVDLYKVLGVGRTATSIEIKRAYRTLLTTAHPDRGGSEEHFSSIKLAYGVLSDSKKRDVYNATGRITRTAEEEFLEGFGGGTYGKAVAKAAEEKENLSVQLALRAEPKGADSHSSGFEAWMRSRGGSATQVITAESMADQYGVTMGTYEPVALPRVNASVARCNGPGLPTEHVAVESEALPPALEWGQVLVHMQAVPMNPGDLAQCRLGGATGEEHQAPPFVPGQDGVGVVVKACASPSVGEGAALAEGDLVMPLRPNMGTWRSLAVWKARNLLRLPPDALPVEHAALSVQLCTAYCLLEQAHGLQAGDAVIFNAANSVVGQALLQLGSALRLRCLAVVREHSPEALEVTRERLVALGATLVLSDVRSLQAQLQQAAPLAALPRLALDAVGGAAAAGLAEALADGGSMVVRFCIICVLSSHPPELPWQAWVHHGQQVRGFNLRKWVGANRKRVPAVLASLGKLVAAGKLQIAMTEYLLATEFDEALEHAIDEGARTKVLLRTGDAGPL